jgi:hypothetical protein
MAWRISGVGRVTVSLRKSTTGETTGCVSSVEAGVEADVEAGVEAGVKEVVEDVRGAEYAGMTCTPLESIADRFSYPRFITPFQMPGVPSVAGMASERAPFFPTARTAKKWLSVETPFSTACPAEATTS